jgi:hypothetical protein
MEERKRPDGVQEKINEIVDSMLAFANSIIEDFEMYTVSEAELAHHIRLAIIFYRAKEHAKENRMELGTS